MSRMYDDADADLAVVQQRSVALVGGGEPALVQALSLRDSGVDVRLALPDDPPARAAADAEGLPVLEAYEACEESDLVVMLGTAAAARALFEQAVEPNLVAGDALVFGHGFAVRFGLVRPPADVDVALVAPLGTPAEQRLEYEHGRGAPVLVAVEQDFSGRAWALALSYAKAIGGTRAGALATTFGEEAEAAAFAAQAVTGGVPALVEASFDALVGSGCQPEVAYLACRDALGAAVDLLATAAPASDGRGVVDDRTRQRLRDLLADIAGGQLPQVGTTPRTSRLQLTGQEVRRLLGWPRAPTAEPF